MRALAVATAFFLFSVFLHTLSRADAPTQSQPQATTAQRAEDFDLRRDWRAFMI